MSSAKKGQIAFDFGKFWFKGQKMGIGQANVKAYNRNLRDLIHHGKANPSMIISHELPLEEAPSAYKHFDKRDEGWTKVSFFFRTPHNKTGPAVGIVGGCHFR